MGEALVKFGLQAGVLGSYSGVVSRQQDAARTAQAVFAGSAAVVDETSEMIPTKDSMDDYTKAVKGIQNDVQELVDSLGRWSEGFARAPQVYQVADARSQQAIVSSLGTLG